MSQRTTSDRSYHAAQRQLDAESRRNMAEVKLTETIEAVVPAMTEIELSILLDTIEQANDMADLIGRPEVVASCGTAKVLLASLDCQYYTGRYGMGMNGR